ncbi:MAG: L-fucose mutarotase [Eggerthellaceae bacterium]|nr:L-fucose mutarotase [Eggerthellaceae bacterium]
MLKGISPIISPELLYALARMGHGDELIFADAHFPGEAIAKEAGAVLVRADGLDASQLMDAILDVFELDSYEGAPMITMEANSGDVLDPDVEASYRAIAEKHGYGWAEMERLDRFDYYDRAKKAFLIVQTGETRKYGNLILRKGVTPSE